MSNKFEEWKKNTNVFNGVNIDLDSTPEEVGEGLAEVKHLNCAWCPARKHCDKTDCRELRCVNAFICLSKKR